MKSDAAISEVREGQGFGVWTSGHVDGESGRGIQGNFEGLEIETEWFIFVY